MTEQEQIEKWRKEFAIQYDLETNNNQGVSYHLLIDDKYCFPDIENKWQGFLMARRNMPVIELPKRGRGYYLDDMVNIDEVAEVLQLAGIPYTIKGE